MKPHLSVFSLTAHSTGPQLWDCTQVNPRQLKNAGKGLWGFGALGIFPPAGLVLGAATSRHPLPGMGGHVALQQLSRTSTVRMVRWRRLQIVTINLLNHSADVVSYTYGPTHAAW